MTTTGEAWPERAIAGEIYGILQVVDSRPFSKGHDGGIREAERKLLALAATLRATPGPLLPGSLRSLLEVFLARIDTIGPEVVARTLTSALHSVLAGGSHSDDDVPWSFAGRLPDTAGLDRLIVAVGPTIGIGDEFIVARALVERCRDLGGPGLFVSSPHAALWRSLDDKVQMAGQTPLGGLALAESLPGPDRARTAYLYVDFLISDPNPDPYWGPADLRSGGRWVMGTRSGEFIAGGMRHRFRYPDGFPDSRWLESRWFAARLLPGEPAAVPSTLWEGPAIGRAEVDVTLQSLTAKPELTFPAGFYHKVFALVGAAEPGLRVRLVPGPTRGGREEAGRIAAAVAASLPHGSVEVPPSMTLDEVHRSLRTGGLLFGPDTFTAHLAAEQNLPQVTIANDAHRPWVNLGAPCLTVSASLPQRRLAAESAAQILALRRLAAASGPLRAAAARLRAALRTCDGQIRDQFRADAPARHDESVAAIRRVEACYGEVAALLGGDPGPASRLTIDAYEHVCDVDRAIVRWYHRIGLSPVVNLATAVPPC